MDLDLNSRSSTLVPESCLEEKTLLGDWSLCVHPQGWIYFFNASLKICTEQDIRDPTVRRHITLITEAHPPPYLKEHMEIQLHVQTHSGPLETAALALIINHKYCVASYDYQDVDDDNVSSFDPHTLNRKRRLYWNYLWNHPSHVPTPERAIPDASDALTWYYTDNLISGPKSLVPFSKTECEDLSKIVQEMSGDSRYQNSVAKTVFLAWLLREVCSFRDSECYGQYTQKAAQTLRRSRTLHSNFTSRRSSPFLSAVIDLFVTLFFFGIPWTYYAHVKDASEYRGRLSNVQKKWETYIERLVREYSHFLLISTVLLSATVGLLAIPDIAQPTKVTAIISSFASLGSIIVGVFCIWRHQTKTSTRDSYTYMHNAQHQYLGLHGHAVLLSLPPVFLVWAIVTFTISMTAYAVEGLVHPHDVHSASAWVVLGILIALLAAVMAALYTFSIIWKFQRSSWTITRLISSWTARRHIVFPSA